ncbi:DUF397 domain-containing protein [Lipingzhangella sp. LS1_29]|uniref:DUF397 domain-containing protein n=1 Tax=Lipingzhangella rawalii TaxID=2055835 RepID=A0ABU2HAC8_9ACTN|nr:DUF397 domain-containing protein [Lipingzhangella rawalii]MDS1271824.1 DUF397 domain-containing protein [Lipingzhangella rawalii]
MTHSIPTNLWRKSSYSAPNNCVEVADQPGVSAVRDSQHPNHGHLAFTSSEWAAFIQAMKTDSL